MNDVDTHQRLMLHVGEHGPVELEVWNEQTESATTISSTWATDPSESKEITRQLHRTGFKLVPIEDKE